MFIAGVTCRPLSLLRAVLFLWDGSFPAISSFRWSSLSKTLVHPLEMIIDLGNDLLSCQVWEVNKLSSPHTSKLEEPSPLDTSIPFVEALSADVIVPTDSWGA